MPEKNPFDYNKMYKKLLVLSIAIKAPEAKEIFILGSYFPSESQLQGWRVRESSRHFRRIYGNQLSAFVDGLIIWADLGK